MFVKLNNARDLRELLEGMRKRDLETIYLQTADGYDITGLSVRVHELSDGSLTTDYVFTTK